MILDKLRNEPALVGNIVMGLVVLGVALGFEIDDNTLGAAFAVFSVLTGIDIRRKVKPA